VAAVEDESDDAKRAARWAEGCRRHELIRKLVGRNGDRLPKSEIADVAWELGISRATLYRLISLFRRFGIRPVSRTVPRNHPPQISGQLT
jgi:transcriptional regulator of acetoin/glycerol metabolism